MKGLWISLLIICACCVGIYYLLDDMHSQPPDSIALSALLCVVLALIISVCLACPLAEPGTDAFRTAFKVICPICLVAIGLVLLNDDAFMKGTRLDSINFDFLISDQVGTKSASFP
jgi:hypothetical protein